MPWLQNLDEELKAWMDQVALAKEAMFLKVHGHLRIISGLQSEIRDFEHTLSLLRDAMMVQKRQFAELEHVAHLPGIQENCLYTT